MFHLIKKIGRYSIQHLSPSIWALILYKRHYGYFPNLTNPRDLNEWIIKLMIKSDTSKWTELADKYAVREYVAACGFSDMLVPLLGVWDNADKINFGSLTPPYVLKNNNGSGTIIFVNDSNTADWDAVRSELSQLLKTKFGYDTGETHYFKIPCKIIAEKMLDASKQDFQSSSLIDYKIWCINGEPQLIVVYYDRGYGKSATKVEIKGIDWCDRNGLFNPTSGFVQGDGRAKAPERLNDILEAAKRLSTGFPQVRVDFYVVDGKPYFGEMTFTSAAAHISTFTRKALVELGQKISMGK